MPPLSLRVQMWLLVQEEARHAAEKEGLLREMVQREKESVQREKEMVQRETHMGDLKAKYSELKEKEATQFLKIANLESDNTQRGLFGKVLLHQKC